MQDQNGDGPTLLAMVFFTRQGRFVGRQKDQEAL